MFQRFGAPSPALVLSLIAIVAASGGFAVAAIPARDGTITACYERKGGEVRIIDEKKKCKRRVERRITWNEAGKDGAAGAQGAQGAAGANGANGANGSDAQFNGAAAGGDLQGSYPSPTLAPPEATRVVGQTDQPDFASPWQISTGFAAPNFYRDQSGRVHLAGSSFHAGSANSAFDVIFTLPPGYRPGAIQRFVGLDGNTPGDPVTIRVDPDGDVQVEDANVPGGAVTIDGITFRATQ